MPATAIGEPLAKPVSSDAIPHHLIKVRERIAISWSLAWGAGDAPQPRLDAAARAIWPVLFRSEIIRLDDRRVQERRVSSLIRSDWRAAPVLASRRRR